jgi:FkbM family methyltransferase
MTTTLLEFKRDHTLVHLINLRIARHLKQIAGIHQASRQHRMAIFANDLIGIDINQFGLYECDELSLMFKFLKPLASEFAKGVALDIGANIGNHSLYFASRFQDVHAFEPNPYTFELLRFNTKWSANVQVHGYGLGDQKGVLDLMENSTNWGASSILIGDKSSKNVVSIEIRTLDSCALDATKLCFVKIDVEGFEAQVIKGGAKMLMSRQPVMVLEQHASEFAGGTSPALDLLTSMGYRFCWQHNQPQARTWLGRRWRELRHMAFGEKQRVVTGLTVPTTNHSMLIAVPNRFQAALGMNS